MWWLMVAQQWEGGVQEATSSKLSLLNSSTSEGRVSRRLHKFLLSAAQKNACCCCMQEAVTRRQGAAEATAAFEAYAADIIAQAAAAGNATKPMQLYLRRALQPEGLMPSDEL